MADQPCIAATRTAPNKVWRHFVYGGLFRSDITRDLLIKHFGANTDAFDRPDDAAYYLFAFDVDKGGRPLRNTFVLSSLAWALGRILNPGPDDPAWQTVFVKNEEAARLDFEHCYALLDKKSSSSAPNNENLETDKDGTTCTDTVASVVDEKNTDAAETQERPLDHDDLIAEVNGCIERLGVGPLIVNSMA